MNDWSLPELGFYLEMTSKLTITSNLLSIDDKAHMKDPYDWAIILGGTNDLAVRRKPEDFYPYLEETWSIPLRNGTKVLALTVPDNADSSLIKRRAKLNSWILANDTQNL